MALPSRAFLFNFFIALSYSLKVIPERAVVVYVNKTYFSYANLTVMRYGRKSDYYVNVEGENLQVFNNNVSLHVIFFEFLHNEYRRSFVEMHFNHLCLDLVEDPYTGLMLKNAGFECPMLPGVHRYMNLTMPMDNLPSVWPFQRGRIDSSLVALNRYIIANVSTYCTFLNKVKKQKRPR